MNRLIEKQVVRPFRWLANRLEQFRTESMHLKVAIGDLILNLNCLQGKRSNASEKETVLVAVHHAGFQWYLIFLRAIGIIRNVRIVVVRTGVEMSRLLDELRPHSPPAEIILGRNLYFRYHHLIAGDETGCRATII